MNKITLIGEKMKLRRSERMVVISNYLINHPYELTSLNTFAEKYESAKSSISARPSQIQKLRLLYKVFVISCLKAIGFFLGAIFIYLICSALHLF